MLTTSDIEDGSQISHLPDKITCLVGSFTVDGPHARTASTATLPSGILASP